MRQQSNDAAAPSKCYIDKQSMANINAIAFADNNNKISLELLHSLHPIHPISLELWNATTTASKLQVIIFHENMSIAYALYAPKWNHNRFNIEMFILLQAFFLLVIVVCFKFLHCVDQHRLIRFQNTRIRLNEHEQAIHKLFMCYSFIVYTLDFVFSFFISLLSWLVHIEV